MLFRDRRDAGEKLALEVDSREFPDPLIVAVPRGGVVVAAPLASRLQSRMKVIIPRKVGVPGHEELAAAALTPDGNLLYNERVMASLNLQPEDLEGEVQTQKEEIRRREKVYGHLNPLDAKGKQVLLVDDGIATGLTVLAAIQSLRRMGPDRVVLLVPVLPGDVLPVMEAACDKVIYLAAPEDFLAVGAFYREFAPVADDQVLNILNG